jgi:hypothetical protein
MTDKSRVLLAYTTANNARPLYRRDSLNAVALPEGWTITLSYRAKWIEPSTIADLKEDLLQDCELLFLVVKGEECVPLRHCKVLKALMPEDDLAVLHLEVGRRPSEDLVSGFRALANENKWPVPGLDGGVSGSKYYLGHVRWESSGMQATDFDLHVEKLRKCIEPAESRYFKINRLLQIKTSLAQISSTPRNREASELTLLDLRAGEIYNLETYIHSSSLLEGKSPIELVIQGSHVDIAEPLIKQYGSGALISHLIAVKRQYASELATLVIRLKGPEKEDPRLRPAWYFWPLAIGFFLLGNIGLDMTKEALGAIHHFSNPEAAVLFSKLVGSGLLALAGWLAFRTVPIKL